MNNELRNQAWTSLPEEFRREVEKIYESLHDSIDDSRLETLEYLFGAHNLSAVHIHCYRFKVGDRVMLLTDDLCGTFKRGGIYTITRVRHGTDAPYVLDNINYVYFPETILEEADGTTRTSPHVATPDNPF